MTSKAATASSLKAPSMRATPRAADSPAVGRRARSVAMNSHTRARRPQSPARRFRAHPLLGLDRLPCKLELDVQLHVVGEGHAALRQRSVHIAPELGAADDSLQRQPVL